MDGARQCKETPSRNLPPNPAAPTAAATSRSASPSFARRADKQFTRVKSARAAADAPAMAAAPSKRGEAPSPPAPLQVRPPGRRDGPRAGFGERRRRDALLPRLRLGENVSCLFLFGLDQKERKKKSLPHTFPQVILCVFFHLSFSSRPPLRAAASRSRRSSALGEAFASPYCRCSPPAPSRRFACGRRR